MVGAALLALVGFAAGTLLLIITGGLDRGVYGLALLTYVLSFQALRLGTARAPGERANHWNTRRRRAMRITLTCAALLAAYLLVATGLPSTQRMAASASSLTVIILLAVVSSWLAGPRPHLAAIPAALLAGLSCFATGRLLAMPFWNLEGAYSPLMVHVLMLGGTLIAAMFSAAVFTRPLWPVSLGGETRPVTTEVGAH
jgi:hypothetical protein